jgi:hypothetical protein
MTIDKEKLKDAFNKFVEDDFVSSKEILKKEFKKAKNDKLKTDLDLKEDPIKIDDDPDDPEK